MKEIAILEDQYKLASMEEIKQELDRKVGNLKLIEASQVAKSIMYAQQQVFEHRDKPNKQLARIRSHGKIY